MSAGWKRHEVAIGVGCPPLIMVADARTRGRTEGAARYWATYHAADKMLVLRATISVRSTDPDPTKTAATRATRWWHKRLTFCTLNLDTRQPVWVWEAEENEHGWDALTWAAVAAA